MDINKIESELGKYKIDPTKLLPLIFQLQIENNALMNVILNNQASYFNQTIEGFNLEKFLAEADKEISARHSHKLADLLSSL